MIKKKGGLGRGLSAILGNRSSNLKNEDIKKYLTDKYPNDKLKNIEISKISDGSIESALSLSKNYENDMK